MSRLKQLKELLKHTESGAISPKKSKKIQKYLSGGEVYGSKPADLLIESFHWTKTSEGRDYWVKYHGKLLANERKSK